MGIVDMFTRYISVHAISSMHSNLECKSKSHELCMYVHVHSI